MQSGAELPSKDKIKRWPKAKKQKGNAFFGKYSLYWFTL